MSMTSLNVSLPHIMREFIEAQCERLGYATASEYLRSLIREAQLREHGDHAAHVAGDAHSEGRS